MLCYSFHACRLLLKTSQKDAEKLLMHSQNTVGSYLVCSSEGGFILLIRNEKGVQRYPISQNGRNFSITSQNHFPSIRELVSHYSQHPEGLCLPPMHPCRVSEKPQTAGQFKQAIQEWIIDRQQIRLLRRVGMGSLGEVWEGVWNGTTSVAVKTIKPGTISPDKFLLEIEVMAKFCHTNLIQLYAVCAKEEPIYIITEFMKHGSLLEYLREEGKSLKLPQLISLSTQISYGMAYLEQHNYVHRDLAARNVLMGENLTCKVADYALNEYLYNECGKIPIKWTAPEAALFNQFTVKSDVWSFGIVIYEIITYGRFPYPGMTNAQVLEVLQQGYRMPRPMGCPDKLYDIMLYCWRTEPDDATDASLSSVREASDSWPVQTGHSGVDH